MQREVVINAIACGIQGANKTYEKWTNGAWLNDSGVEHLMQVKIAENIYKKALNKNGNTFETLALEVLFSDLKEESQCTSVAGRNLTILNPRHRVDLALFHKSGRPAAAIEIKRKWEYEPCYHDLKRLIALLKRYGKNNKGSLKFTCLAVFLAFQSKNKLYSKYDEIKNAMDMIVKKEKFELKQEIEYLSCKSHKNLDNPWFSGGVVISLW